MIPQYHDLIAGYSHEQKPITWHTHCVYRYIQVCYEIQYYMLVALDIFLDVIYISYCYEHYINQNTDLSGYPSTFIFLNSEIKSY